MKHLFIFSLVVLIAAGCQEEKEYSSVNPVNWEKRTIGLPSMDSIVSGSTYLSVYSQIYSLTEHLTHDLTATVSMRNINRRDTVYLTGAEYFDTHGNLIRTYFKNTIYIAPMETIEIVIDEHDREGGTGANFIFDWKAEAVMISTSGQQGLSFSTQGKRIE